MPRYYMGVDWADQTHAIWVVDDTGAKVLARPVPHTAEGLSELGRALYEWQAAGIEVCPIDTHVSGTSVTLDTGPHR